MPLSQVQQSLANRLEPAVAALIDMIRARFADGFQLEDVYVLLTEGIGYLVEVARELPNATDEDILAVIESSMRRIYDEVLAPMDIPGIPNFIEPAVDDAAGRLVGPVVRVIASFLLRSFRGELKAEAMALMKQGKKSMRLSSRNDAPMAPEPATVKAAVEEEPEPEEPPQEPAIVGDMDESALDYYEDNAIGK